MTKFPGGHRGRVPPVPIPNTEVKPATADGTACVGVWESRSLPGIFFRRNAVEAFRKIVWDDRQCDEAVLLAPLRIVGPQARCFSKPALRRFAIKFPGGHRGRVTPVPIPNTEVKPATADGTACAGAWESRSLPGLFFAARFVFTTKRAFVWTGNLIRSRSKFPTSLMVSGDGQHGASVA